MTIKLLNTKMVLSMKTILPIKKINYKNVAIDRVFKNKNL